MSQKKAVGPVKKAAVPVAKPAVRPAVAAIRKATALHASGGPPKKVAYHPRLIEDFVLGNITLGELEGVSKEVQYQIAQRGYSVLNQGKLEKAKTIFRGLLALDPLDSYFHTAYGSALQREGNYVGAEQSYTSALKFNPFNSSAFANRGEIRFQAGRILEAASDLQNAIKNDPQGKDPATVRARALALAISDVIRENQEAIVAELKKAQEAAKKAPKAPPPGKGPGKVGAASKAVAPSKPGKPAAPAKKK